MATVVQMSGAITNLVFRCSSPVACQHSTVIVRVFGSGNKLFSQQDERNVFMLASELGIGPACLVRSSTLLHPQPWPQHRQSLLHIWPWHLAMAFSRSSVLASPLANVFRCPRYVPLPALPRHCCGSHRCRAAQVEFENGRVEEFIPGANLSADTIRQPAVSAAIARAMAAFQVEMLAGVVAAHGAEPPPPQLSGGKGAQGEQQQQRGASPQPRPAIWDRIRGWHAAALQLCGAELKQLGLGDLEAEVERLEASYAQRFPAWVGFCHNDLQYGNMLWLLEARETSPAAEAGGGGGDGANGIAAHGVAAHGGVAANGGSVVLAQDAAEEEVFLQPGRIKLIDYEYSTLNDVAFDVANHWSEWAADYHADEAHMLDFSRMPTEEQQQLFCRAYVEAMQGLLQRQERIAKVQLQHPQKKCGTSPGGQPPSPAGAADGSTSLAAEILGSPPAGAEDPLEAVAELLRQKAVAALPLPHLVWGLWGLIQQKTSDVDFDYYKYSTAKIDEYHRTKHLCLA